jgi:adenine-specific DNA-methyltransferase
MYAPRDDERIAAGERVFYTRANARRLDNLRRLLVGVAEPDRTLLLGPLLSAASMHANTAGVFKGFYKDRRTGVGRFGGTNADALARITKPIRLAAPILSRFDCDAAALRGDALAAADAVRGLDLAYLDPPYNQHPYGSNYFMLNLLCDYRRPAAVSPNSGIPADWRRSAYNARGQAFAQLQALLARLDAPFVMLSFNNEGFVPPAELRAFLEKIGRCETVEIPYRTFRGSRNLAGRSLQVVEQLFLVERR